MDERALTSTNEFVACLDHAVREALERPVMGGSSPSGLLELYVTESISSTMDWSRGEVGEQLGEVLTLAYEVGRAANSRVQFFLAREQTKGRGREGRSWLSPRDAGVWITGKARFERGTQLQGLSLLVGAAVIRALRRSIVILNGKFADRDKEKKLLLPEFVLKWPNDIGIIEQAEGARDKSFRKLAGILCESQQHGSGDSSTDSISNDSLPGGARISSALLPGAVLLGPWVQFGIGINLQIHPGLSAVRGVALHDLVHSRCEASSSPISVLDSEEIYFALVGELIRELLAMVGEFQQHGLKESLADVRRYSLPFNGWKVTGACKGTVAGIADDGALLVEPAPGRRERCYSGEVSVEI